MWDSFVDFYKNMDMSDTFTFWFGVIATIAAFLSIIEFFRRSKNKDNKKNEIKDETDPKIKIDAKNENGNQAISGSGNATLSDNSKKAGNDIIEGNQTNIHGVPLKDYEKAIAKKAIIENKYKEEKQRREELEKQLEELTAATKEKAPESTAKINEFNIEFKKGDNNNALKILKDLFNIKNIRNKIMPELLFMEALTHQEAGSYQKSIDKYDEYLKLKPDDAKAYNNRGNAYSDLKQYEKAIKDYDKAIKLDENLPQAYNNRGIAYSDLKQYDLAIKDYDKAIKLDENNAVVYNNRGLAYDDLKQYKNAIKDYDKAIMLDENDAEAYNNRGLALAEGLKQYEKAIKDFDKAIELDENDAETYANRGAAKAEGLKKYKSAIKDYDKAIELDENLVQAYVNRGAAYNALKQYEKAIKDYDKAIKLDENYVAAYNNRGNAYYHLKQYEKAIIDYDKAIKLDENDASAYGNLAELYFIIDEPKKAQNTIKRAFKIKSLEERDKLVFHFLNYLFLDKAELIKVKNLLENNFREDGWSFDDLTEKACLDEKHDCDFIKALAKVINGAAELKSLDKYSEWQALK